jgi:histidine triad (HIT) family protein
MRDCVFCRIVAGEAHGEILCQDEQVTVFRDIHPVAPTHVLVVPNKHIATVNDLSVEDEPLIGHMFSVARLIAEQEGVNETGYRLIVNTNAHAGQMVYHLHLHVIGGQRMRYPMG